jgi:alpha-D-xyloside xylohydrolase
MQWKLSGYERAKPIFDTQAVAAHPIESVVAVDPLGPAPTELALTARTVGDKRVRVRISFADAEVARLQWAHAGEPTEHLSEMLVGPPPQRPLTVRIDDAVIRVCAGGTELVITRDPWSVRFGPYVGQRQDTNLLEHVAPPSGWLAADAEPDNVVRVYETFALRPGEQLTGLGERFTGPALRGRRLAHFIDEPGGTNTTDRTYKSVPVVISSRGYGLFFHHGEEITFDLGATSTQSATALVDSAELDLFLIAGTPKEILTRYTALTGRPGELPDWSYGVWMSKCMYASRAEVEQVLTDAEQHRIPISVIALDPMWLAGRDAVDFDACDFRWSEAAFGDRDEFFALMAERGVKVCLWVNGNVVEDSPAYRPERLVSGGRDRDPCFPVRAFVDYTGPGGDWWVGELSALRDAGMAAAKLDYGELVPVRGRFADGRTGRELHNLYGLLGSMTAARAGVDVTWTRSGTAGSQRYPVHWAGDTQSTWGGLAGALRGGLSAAWSGFAHWSHDIGGFFAATFDGAGALTLTQPDPELFIRWAQFGLLCSHSRFHGMGGREPWLFGEDAVRICRDFIALRERLRPYLREQAAQASRTGWPILRPLALEDPDDPVGWSIDTEYLLGPDLLVVPVLEPAGRVRVYLPAGQWREFFTGELVDGPRWLPEQQVGLDRLPLYVRAGTDPFAGR